MSKKEPPFVSSFWLTVRLILILGLGSVTYLAYGESQYQTPLNEKDHELGRILAIPSAERWIKSSKELLESTDFTEFRQGFRFLERDQDNVGYEPTFTSWNRREVDQHLKAIEGKHFDFIVLPIQENLRFYDLSGRLMSAHWIAEAIRSTTGKTVMSPELAIRLLGGRAIRFNEAAVNKLADRVGANVIHLFNDGSNRYARKRNRLAVVETTSSGLILKRHIHLIEETADDRHLEMIVRDNAYAIVANMYGATEQVLEPIAQKTDADVTLEIPDRLDELVTLAKSPIQHAAFLQLIGMLTPSNMVFERRRLFERSLVALGAEGEATTHRKLLEARAMFYIGRRPVSMLVLDSVKSPVERALKEYLNGNYPELKALVGSITSPLFRLMAEIELNDLHYSYAKQTRLKNDDNGMSVAWRQIAISAKRDSDEWYAPDKVGFFTQLNGLFPEFDTIFKQVVNQQTVSGAMVPFMKNESLMELVFEQVKENRTLSNCCFSYGGSVEPSDIWRLYRNLAVANVLRDLRRSVHVHGNYSQARKFAEKLEPHFDGQPTFSRLYAEALDGYARKIGGAEKRYLLEKINSLIGMVESQSSESDSDAMIAGSMQAQMSYLLQRDAIPLLHPTFGLLITQDYPPNSSLKAFWSMDVNALAFTNKSFMTLKITAENNDWDDNKVIQELEGRFNGYPKKVSFLSERLIASGKTNKAIDILSTAIKNDSDDWFVYQKLAELYASKFEYEKARKTYLQYPQFSNPENKNRVTIANYAYDGGNTFYWRGQHEDAKPLYEIAAALNTGGGAEYASRQRLAMMKHDYRNAITFSYKRGQRYNSHYGYRDYLAFLNLIGAHQQAEAGFKALAFRYTSPQLWTGLLIGHRIQRRTSDEVKAWIETYLNEVDSDVINRQVQRHMFMQVMVDREPDHAELDLVDSLRDFYQPDPRIVPTSDVGIILTEGLGSPDQKCSQVEGDCGGDNTEASSYHTNEYAGFLDAYIDFRKGLYWESLVKFLRYDRQYPVLNKGLPTFALPYIAMAASKAVAPEAISTLLDKLEEEKAPEGHEFDYALTKSVALLALNRKEDSLETLKTAFVTRPHTGNRPVFSWYQLTEVAQWLFDQSGDRRFIDIALDWAKRYQVIQPQFAWAYAFEALYSENEELRVRAAGFAEYLDADSAWLSKVPETIRKKGSDAWKKNNPFIIKEERNTSMDSSI